MHALAVLVLAMAPVAPAASSSGAANQALLRSARTWEVREREDLARLALEKLVAARPDRTDFVLLLAEMDMRVGDLGAARVLLARLETEHPGEEAARTLATEIRVATVDRLKLASVRRLVELDRGDEVRAALADLFPQGAPGGALGIEYYRLLAQAPGGWGEVRQGLERLMGLNPDDPRYRLALARHLATHADTASQALEMLRPMRRREDLRQEELVAAEDAALKVLGRGRRATGAARLLAAASRTGGGRPGGRRGAPAQPVSPPAAAVAADVPRPSAAALAAAAEWRARGRDSDLTGAPALAASERGAADALEAGDVASLVADADALEAAGAASVALALLRAGEALVPESDWLFESEIRLRLRQGDFTGALARLDERPVGAGGAAASAQLRASALDARAMAATERGDTAAARSDLEQALALAPGSAWIRFHLARRYLQDGEPARGRALLVTGRAAAPEDAELAYAEALFLESIDQPVAALAAIATIPAGARSPGVAALEVRLRERLAPTPPARPALAVAAVEGAAEWRDKPGSTGISALSSIDVPFEWHADGFHGATLFATAEALRLDAGTLPGDYPSAALLGSVQAYGPSAPRTVEDGRASGVALGAGLRAPSYAFDVGTTPLGFPIRNLVGGVRYTPTVGRVDLRFEAYRRPVTASLLSFAGRRDPASGALWGGVVETGVGASAARYEDNFSLAAALKIAALAGTHVLANHYVSARLAGDHEIFRRGRLQASAGAALSYWSYAEDLLNYTYGQGGYYSPKSYLSVALPLEIGARGPLIAYRVRAAVAYSDRRDQRTAYYPLDPALMAAALAQPATPGVGAPYFDGGHGHGISVSLYAAFERLVAERTVLGIALDIDRSDYYRPTALTFYVRHALGGAPAQLFASPHPPTPYSRY